MAVTDDGRKLYISCGNGIVPVNTVNGRAGLRIPVPAGPIVFTPNGKRAYVASGQTVTPVNTRTGRVGKPIVVAGSSDGPTDLAVTPDGKTVFALNNNSVVPIRTATNRPGPAIPLAVPASTMVMAPDGRTLYVLGDASVVPVNVRTLSAGLPIAACPSGACGFEMAITPDGKTLYVPDFHAGTVVPLSTVTHRAGEPIKVGAIPWAVVVTPDGRTVLVACGKSLYRISTATRRARWIPLTFRPAWIVITPDGKTAWVSGDVTRPSSGFYWHRRGYVVSVTISSGRTGRPVVVGPSASCLLMQPWESGQATGPGSCPP